MRQSRVAKLGEMVFALQERCLRQSGLLLAMPVTLNPSTSSLERECSSPTGPDAREPRGGCPGAPSLLAFAVRAAGLPVRFGPSVQQVR